MQYLLRAALRAVIVCAACAAVAAQAQSPVKGLLWQVKSKDNTVYLYGTIHVGKPSLYPLPDAVENAFRQAARLAVEADVTDQAGIAAILPLLRYTPPDSLDTQIQKPILERLKAQLAHYGIPYDSLKQMKPFMVGGLLSIAEFTRLGYDHRFGVDGYFIEQAVLDGKAVLELESVEQQMRMLNSLSAAEQEAFLANTLTALESGKAADQVTGMFDAWRSGDAALLDEVVKKANEGMSLTEVLDEKMLYGRNPAMLSKIEIFLAGNQVRCRRRATPNRQARSCRNVEGEGVQDQAIVNWMQPSDLVWDNARPGGHLVACNSQFESALRAWPAGCGVARLANMRRLFDAARFVHPARPGAPFTPLLTVTGH